MFNIISKVIRRLIEIDILGNRFINLMDMGVSYDPVTKRLFQKVEGIKVYLARCSHGVPKTSGVNMVDWLNKQVYFSHYMPKGNDVYVDVGCGYGHELVFIAKKSPNVKILGIEANPEILQYCKASTASLKNVNLLNLMIGEQKTYKLPFTTDYAGKGSNDDGFIECKGLTFERVLDMENINSVSLLKLNIEGGEKEFIEQLPHTRVKSLIVSCHDFRSERGDGEFYRTYDAVKENLIQYGYKLSQVIPETTPSAAWKKSIKYWIYATKNV